MPATKAASAAFVIFGAGASDPVGRIPRMPAQGELIVKSVD